jgi:hypothetical protein
MKKFGRRKEVVEVELITGEKRQITIYELSNEGMARWHEFVARLYEGLRRYYQEYDDFLAAGEQDTERIKAFVEEMKGKDFINSATETGHEIWQIMTEEEDTSWAVSLYPSTAAALISEFHAINKEGFDNLKKATGQAVLSDRVGMNLETAGDLEKLLNS